MKIKNFRWWIVVLIALATAINYLDRQSLPIAISELRKSFAVRDVDYGFINSLFLFAYGTMYAVGGRLLDLFGTKRAYTAMIIWWSLANMLHGFVNSVTGLGTVRLLLGIGEGGAFPGAAKAISEWFPLKERSLAFGIFNTGSSIGAVVAPPLIAGIIAAFNWRWAFFICGSLGLLWVWVWHALYSVPAKSKLITEEEQNFLAFSLHEKTDQRYGSASWKSLFGYRKVWGLMLIKFLTDAGWFFFIFWLPKYLHDARGLDIKNVGSYAWIPYAFAGLGSFAGGGFSSFLLKKKVSLDRARKIPLALSALLLPFSLLIAQASLSMALVFFSMAMFGHQCWSTIIQTLPADFFPSRLVGTVAGLMGCVGTYGAMLFSLLVGRLVQDSGYGPAFLIAGMLHPLSFLLLLFVIGKIEKVSLTLSAGPVKLSI